MTAETMPTPAPARRTIAIAGASGFVGAALAASFAADGHTVRTIGRAADATWSDTASIRSAVDGADVLINLAGKSVNCRYTTAAREEILRSRVETTRSLRDAVTAVAAPPAVWLNASTATIYRHETVRPNTERDGILGSGFSVDVARAWEAELFAGELPATRRVALRMAIVLGDGPATRTLLRLARWGLGGPQFDGWAPGHRRYRGIGPFASAAERVPQYRTRGRQRFSWIHIDDVVGAVRFLTGDGAGGTVRGPVNLASPEASDNRELMRTLRRVVGAPVGLPSARWMLEPAMWALRTEPELVLKSRWVAPEVLTAAGYRFRRPHLDEAVREVWAAQRRGRDGTSL
jgi:NAD dependent epimerase/dehydratase family enzyme